MELSHIALELLKSMLSNPNYKIYHIVGGSQTTLLKGIVQDAFELAKRFKELEDK